MRRVNADAVLADDAAGFYAVADGVGSSPDSVQASRTAVDEAHRAYIGQREAGGPDLERLVAEAYAAYLDRFADRSEKPSTTLTVLVFQREVLHYVSVGDSPAFLLDQDRVSLLTRHHTMVDQSRIMSNFSELKSLDGSNVLVNSFGNHPPRAVTYAAINAPSPCRLLVCTDGLMDFLLQDDLGRLSRESRDARDFVRRLQAAAADGRPRDNYSGIVIDLSGQPA